MHETTEQQQFAERIGRMVGGAICDRIESKPEESTELLHLLVEIKRAITAFGLRQQGATK